MIQEEKIEDDLKQEEDLALKQLCLDRHLPEISNKIDNWESLHSHCHSTIDAAFSEFTINDLEYYKQSQFKFLQLWKRILESKATYCNLCECFRSAENLQADSFTRILSISSLKEIIKGIIRSNHDFLIHTLDPDHTLSMMCSRGLLSDDEVEMINYAPTEDKKCNSILMVLRRSSVTCFQKFVLLLSEVDTSEDIVKRIVDDLQKNEVVNFLPSSTPKPSNAVSSTLRKRQVQDDEDVPCSKRVAIVEEQEDHDVQSIKQTDDQQQSNFFQPDELSTEFVKVLDRIMDCLQSCRVSRLITNFNVFMASHTARVPFFPKDMMVKIQECKNIDELFKQLSPYISWQRLHVLQLLVDASKCKEAQRLLAELKAKIDKNRQFTECAGINHPSNRIVPSQNSLEALITTKCSQDNVSLSDVDELRKELADSSSTEESVFEPVATQEGCTIIYWLVIRSVLGLIINGVRNNLPRLYAIGIIEVSVDPDVTITTVPGLRIRSLAYLTEPPTSIQELKSVISKMQSDLLAHVESLSSPELLEFKQKLQVFQEKCHRLGEMADEQMIDLVSLKEKVTQLEDSRKTIEEAKFKISQMQSSHEEMESKLSLLEVENSSLKAEKKSLVSHVSVIRDRERQKDSELRNANQSVEELLQEVNRLKEEKLLSSKEKKTVSSQSASVEDPEKYTANWTCTVITGYENVKFGRPDAIAIGPNQEVLVCDYKHQCVFVLDDQFNLLRVLGTTGDGRLTHPNGIAVNQNGTIAVSDYRFHQVKKFSLSDGTCICSIGAPGQEDGNFDYPRGLAFSSDGHLYVMDWGNSRIQVFNQQNEFTFKFGTRGLGPAEFDHPTRIAMDSSDNVYVANYNSSTIGIFTNLGKFLASIPTNKPFAIAVTPKGHILADDNDKNLIRLWNPSHQLIGQFGTEGDQKGEFNSITDMAIGKNGVYVVDARNKRLQLIEGIRW